MTIEEWRDKPSKIPLWQLMASCHYFTERLRIEVVIGDAWLDEKNAGNRRTIHDFTLTEDAFADYKKIAPVSDGDEIERLLHYYADAPCWNVTADFKTVRSWQMKDGYNGRDAVTPIIVARVHYRDIREGYLRERDDIRKAKNRKKAEEKRKEKNNGERA